MGATVGGRRPSSAERKQSILDSAVRQFAERGYEAVGMRDIADDAGLSAPGIYRHFSSKEELLTKIFDRLSDRLADAVRSAERIVDPSAGLDSLIGSHIRETINHNSVIPILYSMMGRLSSLEQDRFRAVSRSYFNAWVARLRELRPDLNESVARISVHAAFGLINSLGYHSIRLPDRPLMTLLTGMTRRALGLPAEDG